VLRIDFLARVDDEKIKKYINTVELAYNVIKGLDIFCRYGSVVMTE